MKKNIIIALFIGCITTSFTAIQSAEGKSNTAQPTQESIATVLKNGQTVTVSAFNPRHNSREALELLNKSFDEHFNRPLYFNEMVWVHAHIANPDQEKSESGLAAVALYWKKKTKNDIHLERLATTQHHQKKGIGSVVIDYIAKTTQCETMSLYGLSGSHDFYTKLGFTKKEESIFSKHFTKEKP